MKTNELLADDVAQARRGRVAYNQLLNDAISAPGEDQTVSLEPLDGNFHYRLTVKVTGEGRERIAKWTLGGRSIQPFMAELLLIGYAVGARK